MRARSTACLVALVLGSVSCGGGGGGDAVRARPVAVRSPGGPADRAPTTTATTAPAPAVTAAAAPATVAPPVPAAEPVRRVLVVGDSIAELTARHLAEVAAPTGVVVANGGVWGCGVAEGGPLRYFGAVTAQPPNCDGWADRWAGLVAAHDPDVTLVVVGRWEVMDRVHDGAWMHIGEPVYDAYLRAQLERAVGVLSAGGGRVVLATAPYYLRGLRPDGGLWPEDEPGRVDRYNGLVAEVAGAHPGVVSVVDLGERVTPGDRYVAAVDGVVVRRDGVHLTDAGERWLAPWLLQQVVAPAP